VPLTPEKTILAVYQDAPEIWHCGVMQACIWYWLRKRQIWSQLMATGERFAEPIPVGYYGVDEENGMLEGQVLDAQEAYGPGGTIALPGTGAPLSADKNGQFRGAYLSLEQPDLRVPTGFWTATLEQCDREMAIAYTGGNLLTDTTGGAGVRAAQEGQADSEREGLTENDADWLAMGAAQDLARMILLFNKGPEAAERLPFLGFPGLQKPENLELKSTVYKTLGETNWDAIRGIPDEMREVFEIPEMEEPEEPETPPPVPPVVPPVVPPEEEPEIPVQTCDHFEAADPGIDAIKNDIASLIGQVQPFSDQAAEKATDRVTAYLLRMKRPPKTPEAFQKAVLRHIDTNFEDLAQELDHAGMTEWFESTYKEYKTQDRTLWKGKTVPPVAISFGLKDKKSAAIMSESANWFFSTFTENDTFRVPMQKFLTRAYMTDGAQLFVRNPAVVKAFARTLGDTTKALADHEIDRIARTSVARAREQARIMQMSDAGVKEARVRTAPGACEICAPYNGKTFSVSDEVAWIDHMESLTGDDWIDAVKSHQEKAVQGVPPHEMTTGEAGSPLYHPNCKCSVDLV